MEHRKHDVIEVLLKLLYNLFVEQRNLYLGPCETRLGKVIESRTLEGKRRACRVHWHRGGERAKNREQRTENREQRAESKA
jgi:hypothetical protein